MKTAFVTGGAGFLGRNLVEELLSSDFEVVVFDLAKPDAVLAERGVSFVQGDLTDASACERAMPEGIDAVFHVAADTTHWKLGDAQQTKVNVDGTRAVAAAAIRRKAGRFILTSSIAAFGFQSERMTEDTISSALQSSINYFRTKRRAELEVLKALERGLDAVIVNPANIIGRYDASGWSRFFRLIEEGSLPGVPSGSGSFCHAREVARAHVAAFERGRTGHHYLLGGVDATFLEVVQRIGALLDRPVPKRPIPAFVSKAAGQLSLWGSYLTRREPDLTPEKAALLSADLLCSSDKAENELAYRPVALQVMLEDCYRWLCEEGLAKSGLDGRRPAQ
ncbi:MAG: oxidoreductase [Deltaproteobacteria bacterium]|nr:MAG: oxidoreductase [Deltaproteobacteria bacterium]